MVASARLALLADLHANREAVSAVMTHALQQGAERFVFLGDLVGYGPDPGWVVDLVRAFVADGALAVLGNHDQAVVRGPSPGMRPEPRRVVAWTRERLSATQIAFLAGLPLTAVDDDRLYVHANAWAPADWGYVLGRSDAVRSLLATGCPYTFCGHVHEPRLYHLAGSGRSGEFVPTPGTPIPLPAHRQWLAIPGSAGQPRDGNPAACYAIFDTSPPSITYHRVPYDHDATAAKVLAAGLPQDLAERLADGQ